MNLIKLTINLSRAGYSVETITKVLRQLLLDKGKTEAEIETILGVKHVLNN